MEMKQEFTEVGCYDLREGSYKSFAYHIRAVKILGEAIKSCHHFHRINKALKAMSMRSVALAR